MARHQRIARLFDDNFWGTQWRSQVRACISNCRALIMVCRRLFSANSSETNLRIEDNSALSFSNSFLMSASCSFIDTKIHKTIQTAKQKRHLFYWNTIIYPSFLSINESVTEPIKIIFLNNAIPQILYITEGIWVVTNNSKKNKKIFSWDKTEFPWEKEKFYSQIKKFIS